MFYFITGLITGILTCLTIIQLVKQKRLSLNGWVPKAEGVNKYWFATALYAVAAVASFLYMIYR